MAAVASLTLHPSSPKSTTVVSFLTHGVEKQEVTLSTEFIFVDSNKFRSDPRLITVSVFYHLFFFRVDSN